MEQLSLFHTLSAVTIAQCANVCPYGWDLEWKYYCQQPCVCAGQLILWSWPWWRRVSCVAAGGVTNDESKKPHGISFISCTFYVENEKLILALVLCVEFLHGRVKTQKGQKRIVGFCRSSDCVLCFTKMISRFIMCIFKRHTVCAD